MRIAIENHEYAPELNAVFVRGKRGLFARLKTKANAANGLKTIKDVRKKFFKAYKKPFIYATFTTEFAPPYQDLNRTHAGTVKSRLDALRFKREHIAKNSYGQFIDMSKCEYVDSYTMPTPKMTLTTKLIG
jgi:hypothetical protein